MTAFNAASGHAKQKDYQFTIKTEIKHKKATSS